MKNIIGMLFLLTVFINGNLFAYNSQFKAFFEDDGIIINQKTKVEKKAGENKELILEDPVYKNTDIDKDLFTKRVLTEKKDCLIDNNGFENCTDNMIQCNQVIKKDTGLSKKNKRVLSINKIKIDGKYVCPDDFVSKDNINSENGFCIKEYYFYTYSCKKDENAYGFKWVGPLIQTGEDCLGNCGESGCICNSATPPMGNCIQESASCPIDSTKACTKSKSNEDLRNKRLDIVYDLGLSKKHTKIDTQEAYCKKGFTFSKKDNVCFKKALDFKTNKQICPENSTYSEGKCFSRPQCDSDYKLINGKCKKEYSFFEYSCKEGFKIKESNNNDCEGSCQGYGCLCNSPLAPENNCSKTVNNDIDEVLKFTKKREINSIKIEGSFDQKYDEFTNFNIEDINSIKAKGKLLCFSSNSKEECFRFDGCDFKGSDDFENKYLDVKSHSIGNIKTSCAITGFLGNAKDSINKISTNKDRVLFFNEETAKKIGEIHFLSRDLLNENKDAFNFLSDGFHLFTVNDKSYGASEDVLSKEKCEFFANKFNSKVELIFKDPKLKEMAKLFTNNNYDRLLAKKDTKCIIKLSKIIDFNKDFKVEEIIKDSGHNIFACSPLSCVDGSCQKAICQDGFDGPIQPFGYTPLDDSECQSQVCDANKLYAPLCGKTKHCDISKSDIVQENGSCMKAVCQEGFSFNKDSKKCEK